MKHERGVKDIFKGQPYHILPSQPTFWRKHGTIGFVGKNAPQELRTKARTFFCFPNVCKGPPENITGSHVGKFTFILPYTTLSTERMPTSQIGLYAYLVPSREDILCHNMATGCCGWSGHPSCRSNASGTLIVAVNDLIWPSGSTMPPIKAFSNNPPCPHCLVTKADMDEALRGKSEARRT